MKASNFYVLVVSPWDNLVTSLGKKKLKHLSQEFDSDVLDLFMQKVFYPHEYISAFRKFKKELPSTEKL